MSEKHPRQMAKQLAPYLAPILYDLADQKPDADGHHWAGRLGLTNSATAEIVVCQLERLDSDQDLRRRAAKFARADQSRDNLYSSLTNKLAQRLRAEPEVCESLWTLLAVSDHERQLRQPWPAPSNDSVAGAGPGLPVAPDAAGGGGASAASAAGRRRTRGRGKAWRRRRHISRLHHRLARTLRWLTRLVMALVLLAIASGTMAALLAEPRANIRGVHLRDISPLNLFTILMIVVLAFLPGWLFIRFIRQRGRALWDEYVIHLHRLGLDEPQFLPEPQRSSGYFEAWSAHGGALFSRHSIYRDKFNAYYGRGVSEAAGSEYARPEALFPVFLLTAILAAGWTEVLWNNRLIEEPKATLQALDAVEFGFLGAYLFIVQMLVRRFFQSDLKASAYASAIVRIISVTAIVLVMHQLPVFRNSNGSEEAVVAFVIGFFPLVGMQALQRATSVVLRLAVPSLRSDYPLSDLDGLNIWYEARLLEEGIEDMESLVSANMVDVILHTRVPVGRLVDWIDQAYLYLVLPAAPRWRQQRRDQRSAVERGEFGRPRNLIRDVLREYGVHNATELLRLFCLDQASSCRPRGVWRGRATYQTSDAGENAYGWQDADWPRKLARQIAAKAGTEPESIMALVRVLHTESGLVHVHSWRSWRPTDVEGRSAPHRWSPLIGMVRASRLLSPPTDVGRREYGQPIQHRRPAEGHRAMPLRPLLRMTQRLAGWPFDVSEARRQRLGPHWQDVTRTPAGDDKPPTGTRGASPA